MKLEVVRLMSGAESTVGVLYQLNPRAPLTFTLEDQYQAVKVKGETRIPAGEYRVTLRTEGGFHQRYGKLFPDIHKGMLWIRDVPGFEYVLMHCGNTDADTEGCLLLGDTASQNVTRRGGIGESQIAYRRVYPPIARAIQLGDDVRIRFTDYDMG